MSFVNAKNNDWVYKFQFIILVSKIEASEN